MNAPLFGASRGKLEFLPKLVVHGLQLMQIYSFGSIKLDMIWLTLTNYQVWKPK